MRVSLDGLLPDTEQGPNSRSYLFIRHLEQISTCFTSEVMLVKIQEVLRVYSFGLWVFSKQPAECMSADMPRGQHQNM